MGGLIMAQRKGNGVVKYDNKRKSEAYVRGKKKKKNSSRKENKTC